MAVLGLKRTYQDEQKLYFVNNDTALVNFIYYRNMQIPQDTKNSYKEAKESSRAFSRIKDPHLRALVLTIQNLHLNYRADYLLAGIEDSNDLEMIVNNSKDHLSYKAGNILRKKGNLKYVFPYLWSIKWPIIILLIMCLMILAHPAGGLFALGQLCYVLLVWRFPENAWPGLLGYIFMPMIGIALGGVLLALIGFVYNVLHSLNDDGREISRKLSGLLSGIGMAIACFTCIYILENTFFTNGLDIHGKGAPSGTHYLSDEVLQDESYWGYALYAVNGAEIIFFLGMIYFTIAAFKQDLLEEAFETLYEWFKEFKGLFTS